MSLDILNDAKLAVEEQMKTLPDVGKAEDSDFVLWGTSFCSLVVSSFLRCLFSKLIDFSKGTYNEMAEMFEVGGDDQEVVGWIEEAQEAFKGFKDESWLEWGARLLMPQVYLGHELRLAEEKAAKDREEAEAERTRKIAEEGVERMRRLRELREKYQKQEIGKEEFVREVRKLDDKSESEMPSTTQTTLASAPSPFVDSSFDDAPGDPKIDSSSEEEGADSRLGLRAEAGSKRKSEQDPDELREVEGPVSHFASSYPFLH